MSDILQTIKLTKAINGKTLIDSVDMHVEKSKIYGFVGPNGAGKTTVMKMLTNLWKPTSGKIILFGEELAPNSYDILNRMGSIIEFPFFYDHMSGEENLQLHCDYMGIQGNVEECLEMLGLADTGNKPVGNYSLGMKQRLGIARAIVCNPELLILDEPTNGLDPVGMKQIRDVFKRLSIENGMTIIVSSHILSEVESIADTIGIINHGAMVEEISMKEILEMPGYYIDLSVEDIKQAQSVLSEKMHITEYKISENGIIHIYDKTITTKDLLREMALNNIDVCSVSNQTSSLEDYYLKITEGINHD